MDEQLIDEYLARIGVPRPARPDLQALRDIQRAHVLTVPFENLDYHLDRPFHLDERVVEKVVRERRGGGCYEVNPALARLLRALGYEVSVLPGRVARKDGYSAPMCHMVLRVELDEPWLVDVGFGRNSRLPLALDGREPQADPHGTYQLVEGSDGDLELQLDGRSQYVLEARARELAEFEPTLWWYRTAPESPFLQSTFCVLRTERGRLSLTGRTLTTIDGDGRETEQLDDDGRYLEVLRTRFGIALPGMPGLPVDESFSRRCRWDHRYISAAA